MAAVVLGQRRPMARSIVGRLMLLVGGFLFACLLAEAALRLGGYGRSYVNAFSMFFEVDGLVGVRGRPNFTGRLKNDEMDAVIRHDGRGFRKPAHEVAASSDRRNVHVLGDSFFWGWGVGQGQVITDLIQQRFSDRRVQNLAVASLGTVQEFVTFEKYALPQLRRGDAVVLGFCGANDFRDNLGENLCGRLYATIVDGEIRPDGTACPSYLSQHLRDSSDLFNLLIYSWNRGRAAWLNGSLAPAASPENTDGQALPPIADQEPYADNSPEVIVAAHYLRAFQSACAERGAEFVIVYIPRQEEFGELVEYKGPAFSSRDRQTLLRLSRQLGIDVVDLLPRFRECKRRTPEQRLTYAEGHWNATGHQVAAEAVCEYLASHSAMRQLSARD
jgi:lysophospholipase L1-like esterase